MNEGGGFQPVDVAVVGGGISGLACAFWAKKGGRSVALYEASADVGGSITTVRQSGYIADGGPQSFLASQAFDELVRDAGIERSILAAAPAAQTPYIYWKGKLRSAPRSPGSILTTPLLSPIAKLRLLGEPFVAAGSLDDESVSEFVCRRAGRQVLEALAQPFVSGIYAGDSDKLSVRSTLPVLVRFEREHGSVIRGAIAVRKASQKQAGRVTVPARRKSVGFRGGNDTLPRALATALGSDFTVRARVQAMWQRGQWMELLVGGQTAERVVAKTIVIATQARAAASLLQRIEPEMAQALDAIEHPSVIQIAMAYPKAAIGVPLDGFGFVVPRQEHLAVLGCVWNSVMFDDRCPPDEVLVTAFLGGASNPAAAAQPDEDLAKAAHLDISRIMRIKDVAPRIIAGFRWQEAIPQYNLGHSSRAAAIEAGLKRLPNVRLCGNYLRGPSVPDCIGLAREVVKTL